MPKKLQHPVPNEHLIHIGDITVSFALLESIIQSLVRSFINEHQRVGQIICAELSFKNLRALAISLYLEKYGEDSDYFILKELMTSASNIEVKRNQITHSLWAAGKDKNHITRIKTTAKEKDGLRFKFEDVSISNLSELTNEIKILGYKIQEYWIYLMEQGKAYNNPAKKEI